jgi:hypothetical protein
VATADAEATVIAGRPGYGVNSPAVCLVTVRVSEDGRTSMAAALPWKCGLYIKLKPRAFGAFAFDRLRSRSLLPRETQARCPRGASVRLDASDLITAANDKSGLRRRSGVDRTDIGVGCLNDTLTGTERGRKL